MPALVGEVISSLYNDQGQLFLQIVFFYDPPTRLLRDDDYTVTGGQTKHGALIADNQTGRSFRVVITDSDGNEVRNVQIPAPGRSVTAHQLAQQGITTLDDLEGLGFDLA